MNGFLLLKKVLNTTVKKNSNIHTFAGSDLQLITETASVFCFPKIVLRFQQSQKISMIPIGCCTGENTGILYFIITPLN